MTITLPQNSIRTGPSRFAPIQQTTRAQWLGLWQAFRGMRKIHGEREALVLIEKKCKREALLILEVIL